MKLCCKQDERRDAVRAMRGRVGLDYVEVDVAQTTLYVYFLGKLPPELDHEAPDLARYFMVEGGRRIKQIRVTGATPVVNSDERDDYVVLKLNQPGDFSNYWIVLRGIEQVDPRYDRAQFNFKVDCPSPLDCAPACVCVPAQLDEPEINYLAKDYASFRHLMLDRLAVLMPDWTERHAADLGTALIELLAYTGDYLSYYQDAVATEAYLDTARQRISVRSRKTSRVRPASLRTWSARAERARRWRERASARACRRVAR